MTENLLNGIRGRALRIRADLVGRGFSLNQREKFPVAIGVNNPCRFGPVLQHTGFGGAHGVPRRPLESHPGQDRAVPQILYDQIHALSVRS